MTPQGADIRKRRARWKGVSLGADVIRMVGGDEVEATGSGGALAYPCVDPQTEQAAAAAVSSNDPSQVGMACKPDPLSGRPGGSDPPRAARYPRSERYAKAVVAGTEAATRSRPLLLAM